VVSDDPVCREYGVEPLPPRPGSKVGIALETLHLVPVHGVRLEPTDTTNGWYIFAGDEWSGADDFYKPLCVEHLPEFCPAALPFLALPPGWRFMTDGEGFVDVWYEPHVENE
jgi:hypothetical protein